MRTISRRNALGLGIAAAGGLLLPAQGQAQVHRANVSSFRMQSWEEHFDSLGKGAIVADTTSRALHFWSGDGRDYRIYPTSVPISEELTKRGYTEIVRKKVGPSWTPTPSQMERYPDWKPVGPGPENPLGTHAMYLAGPPTSSTAPTTRGRSAAPRRTAASGSTTRRSRSCSSSARSARRSG